MIIWGVDFIKTNVWNSFQTFVNIGGGVHRYTTTNIETR